jgi:hypothetical protein
VIGQTLAILVDGYRELEARRLFWITILLSAVLVVAFATIGYDVTGLKVLVYHFAVPHADVIYRTIFSTVLIGFWLTWAATVLALVSTAGIFPDFISGGSIDLYLAKPIGRVRLFLTKYVSGLLFVTLQVVVVIAGSFIVLGLRGHMWRPTLFWGIPIVLCFFSYLFAICVLLGMLTRSTIAALLLTILFWTMFALLDRAEPQMLMARNMYEYQANYNERRAQTTEANLRRVQQDPKASALVASMQIQLDEARRQADENHHTARIWGNFHNVIYAIKTVTPKTTDTIELLDRYLFPHVGEAQLAAGVDQEGGDAADQRGAMMEGAKETVQDLRKRSPAWVVGTSLAFEAVVVLWAGWLFWRRDF